MPHIKNKNRKQIIFVILPVIALIYSISISVSYFNSSRDLKDYISRNEDISRENKENLEKINELNVKISEIDGKYSDLKLAVIHEPPHSSELYNNFLSICGENPLRINGPITWEQLKNHKSTDDDKKYASCTNTVVDSYVKEYVLNYSD